MTETDVYLGPCCACGRTQGVSNIILLQRLCPTPGFGWMCYQCGLPANGAAAVLCDACLESGAEIKWVCTGRPADPGRTPIEALPPDKFKHNMLRHPEALEQMIWFDDSPEYGEPDCLCSLCRDLIPAWDDDSRVPPLRLYRNPSVKHRHGQEARFCPDCVPAVLKYMTWGDNIKTRRSP